MEAVMADPARGITGTMPPLGPGTAADGGKREAAEPRFQGFADPLKEVPDDFVVETTEALGQGRIEEVLEQLDRELVALDEVKRRLRELAALLLVERLRQQLGLETKPPTLHMCFTGNPGTGKTTVAMRMGELLYQLGYVRKGHLVVASREDLVGQYVGHTAPRTREVLKRAMGGVLFIDEAYNLYRLDNERDYGQEAVELLLQAMENERHNLVVILAGYREKMERFFTDVPGLSSRVTHHIDFPDYTLDELTAIADSMMREQRYRFAAGAETTFRQYLHRRMHQPRFANGRSVRNALDRARMRQAVRLYELARRGHRLTKRDLVTIESEDLTRSRVFDTELEAGE
jgi:probable Rubsico expression protein CbbX